MRTVIVGAGQFGRMLAMLLRRQSKAHPVGFLEAKSALHGAIVDGLPVMGPDELLESERGRFDAVVLAIASGSARRDLMARCRALGYSLPSIVDPSAIVAPGVKIGEACVVCMSATILNNTQIGEGSVLGTGTTILHDVTIGNYCLVAGGTTVGSSTNMQDEVFVGVGATIASGGISIGRAARLAAGAVILKDVPPNCLMMGNPARVVMG